MQISRKELQDQQIEFTVTPDLDDLKTAKTSALTNLGKEVSVPGFRKGKAPIGEIQKRVGGYRLFQETLEVLAESAYRELLEKEHVFPLMQPSIDISGEESLIEDKPGITFTITVTVRPEPKLPNYKKLKVTYETPNVTSEQTEDALKALFERWKGDQDSNSERKDQKDESPEEAEDGNSDSEDPKFESPSDEWAQTIGAKDLENLKKMLHQNLLMEHSYAAGNTFTRDVLDELVKKTKMDLPMQLVHEDLEKRKSQKAEELEKIGLDLDGFAKQQKTTVEELEKTWLEELKKEYAVEFIIGAIAQKEEIMVSDEEVEAEIKASQDAEALKLFDDPQRKEHLRYMMRRDKTIRRVVEWNMEREIQNSELGDENAKKETSKKKKPTLSKKTNKTAKKATKPKKVTD